MISNIGVPSAWYRCQMQMISSMTEYQKWPEEVVQSKWTPYEKIHLKKVVLLCIVSPPCWKVQATAHYCVVSEWVKAMRMAGPVAFLHGDTGAYRPFSFKTNNGPWTVCAAVCVQMCWRHTKKLTDSCIEEAWATYLLNRIVHIIYHSTLQAVPLKWTIAIQKFLAPHLLSDVLFLNTYKSMCF